MSRQIREQACLWAAEQALPLWAISGFQRSTGLFYERLSFDGTPIELAARRLMVQARQIATYSRAILQGYYQHEFAIDRCLNTLRRRYSGSDGAPGWVFSIGPTLQPADPTRDLYAHAFVLYALAWSYRLLNEPYILHWAAELLEVLDRHFLLEDGSFADSIPPRDSVRRQNPHMHLLEAFLAMAEASGDGQYLERAGALAKFGLTHFLDPQTGLLLEELEADWKPRHPSGCNRVEPGHLFEWSWLLQELGRLSGGFFESEASRFLAFAADHGVEKGAGLIFDAVSETGAVLETHFRLWPHAEAVKAYEAGPSSAVIENQMQADRYLIRLFDVFAPSRLYGGWFDRIGADGAPLVDHMPASSLYHLMGAIFAVTEGKSFEGPIPDTTRLEQTSC
jgi:mannose/cellobiose epimerase-like protein (N-acyl-D-glucosamine 2-epimerase family)